MRAKLAAVLIRLAVRLAPSRAFYNLDDPDPMSDGQWAGLIILHSEAVHGCEHTTQARQAIGMSGPRGQAIAR